MCRSARLVPFEVVGRKVSEFVRRIPRMKEVRKEEEGDMDESQVDSATKTLRVSAFLVRRSSTAAG